MSAPVKMMNSPPAAILPKKPDIRAILPNDCPMIMSEAINLGMFLAVSCARELLIPGGTKSRGAKPSEKLLHAIGKDDDSRDDSQESVDIIRIGLQKGFDHGSQEGFRLVQEDHEGSGNLSPQILVPRNALVMSDVDDSIELSANREQTHPALSQSRNAN